MMKKQQQKALFPFALVEGNIEGLQARHRRSSRMIYMTVVIAILVAAASLPLIRVEVNSQGSGVLRPAMKHAPVTTAVSGRVIDARLEENAPVCEGDTLLVISTDELSPETASLRDQLKDRKLLLNDLKVLTRPVRPEYPTLASAVYQRDYRDYHQRLEEARLVRAHATRHLERQRSLYATETIAKMDFEQAEFDHRMAGQKLDIIEDQQAHLWSQERQRVSREIDDLRLQLARLGKKAANYVVTAPVEGHLTDASGLQPGAYAVAGQTIGVVSPDGNLHVEAFVSPNDIGLLRQGMDVKLQMDAFNHNQWGLASAIVDDIGRDVSEQNGTAVFRVKCTLLDHELALKNGYVGRLRKGMTLTTHFTIARRSLFELLHDNLDDWFNPIY